MTARTSVPEIELLRQATLLTRKWRALLDERLKPAGITLARSTVLYWLAEQPGLVTQRALATVVGIEGPTLVRQLHALEAQGLVERVPMSGDRRAKGIRLTEKARPLLREIDAINAGMVREYFKAIDKRRLASAITLLREVRSGIE